MKPVTLEDILSIRSYGNLSVDNGIYYFTEARPQIDEKGYEFRLLKADPQAENPVQPLSMWGKTAKFFPAGDTIWFAGKRGQDQKQTAIYALPVSGGEAQEVSLTPFKNASIADQLEGYLVLQVTEEGQPDESDYKVVDEVPFWFNGEGFINRQRSRLYLFDEKSGETKAISEEGKRIGSVRAFGDSIYYTEATPGSCLDQQEALYEYHVKDGHTDELLPAGVLSIFDIARLGDELYLIASDNKAYGLNEDPRLWHRVNGEWQPLNMDTFVFGNTIGTDCRLVPGNAQFIYKDELYVLITKVDHSLIAKLENGQLQLVYEFSGSIDSFTLSPEGLAFIGAAPAGLQQLYLISHHTTRQLSHFHEALKGHYIAVPQEILYTSEDGMELKGWVLYPKDYDPKKFYPGILDIHGGPKTVYGPIFYHEMQAWASAGYFVFFCNIHGSDGVDNDFMDIRGKYGEIDFRDLMTFVDTVLEQIPAIDPLRLGVTGGSYGGFMTNWVIGHTDRFKAAASQRSIANWLSFANTSDIGPEFANDQMGCDLYKNPDKMWKHSPVSAALNVKTPTLFIHSDEDYRCPLSEGEQMFTAIRHNGVESRMCIFHGENHELSRSGQPAHRMRRLKEITAWMDRHLTDKEVKDPMEEAAEKDGCQVKN